MCMQLGKVGPFFFIDNTVFSDSISIKDAEKYGDFKTWGSHFKYWDILSQANHKFRQLEYIHFPRGRVTYNYAEDKFFIYLNPKLNTQEILEKIVAVYELQGKQYEVDDKDEHYQY